MVAELGGVVEKAKHIVVDDFVTGLWHQIVGDELLNWRVMSSNIGKAETTVKAMVKKGTNANKVVNVRLEDT